MEKSNQEIWIYVITRILKYGLVNLAAWFAIRFFEGKLLEIGIFDAQNTTYVACFFIVNCTAILYGKLHKIQKMLESDSEKEI